MGSRNLIVISCAGLFSLAFQEPAGAVDVYQWVDENGVTHFSQFAPSDPVAEVNKRTLADDAPVVDPAEDRYAVEQTAKDMQAYRDEMDRKRELRRQQKASTPAPIVVQQYNDAVSYPYWPYRPQWRPDRPGRPGGGPGGGNGPRPTPTPQPPASSGFRKPGS